MRHAVATVTATLLLAILTGAPSLAAPAPASAPDRALASSHPSWAPADQATIYPGVPVVTGEALCTMNFVYLDRGDVLVGMAAHCAGLGSSTDTDGCETDSLPLGTRVDVEGAEHPATLVYSSWLTMQEVGEQDANACDFNDIALARLDPRDHGRVNPSMPEWGGPLGQSDGAEAGEDTYTYGEVTDGPEAKEARITNREGGGWRYAVSSGLNPGVPGDSGSGYLDETGRALGVLSTIELLPCVACNGLTDLRMALDYARTHTSLDPQVAISTEPFGPTGEEPPEQPLSSQRIAGDDRYDTAARVAGTYVEAPTVVIATGVDPADALAAGPGAASIDAPLLLSGPHGLSGATVQRIEDLGAEVAYVVGGPSAVPNSVETQLSQIGLTDVRRLAGTNRYGTAVQVARTFHASGAPVVLASGVSFADALAATPLAAQRGAALLLTHPSQLPNETRALLEDWQTPVTIVGGPAAVGQGRKAEVAAASGHTPDRLEGATRYETAAIVSQTLLDSEGYAFGGRVWLASGEDFPDALSAGPASFRDAGLLLLVPPTGTVPSTVTDLAADSGARGTVVLGGPAAVSDGVVAQVHAALAG